MTNKKEFDIIFSWLKYEITVLNKLIIRNKNQHRGTIFIRYILSSLRFLKKFIFQLSKVKQTKALKSDFITNYHFLYFNSLKFVKGSCVHLTRIHVHKYFVPFSSVLISIFSRLLNLLVRLNSIVKLTDDSIIPVVN
ncbi:hypothetical protein MACK_003894 [Theileria orientalis]|uniref:Uncharacterized protein n=1 Tax=Theileria orientalis TaxID=68886 RepID=A0A976SJ06_THEOR|nr:hypothetical protein MACK_003894 [Theileria orientalis]